MRRRRRASSAASLVVAAALLLGSGAIAAEPGAGWQTAPASAPVAPSPVQVLLLVGVRAADHVGFGRLVLDLPTGAVATVATVPGGVGIRIGTAAPGSPGAGASVRFGPLPAPPRNAGPITFSGGAIQLAVAAGAVLRQSRLPGRLIFDFLDPVRGSADPQAVAKPSPTAPNPPIAPARRTVVSPPAIVAPAGLAGPPLARAPPRAVPPRTAPIVAAPVAAAPVAAAATVPAPIPPVAIPASLVAAETPARVAPEGDATGVPAVPVEAIALPAPAASPSPALASPAALATEARLPILSHSGVAALRRGDLGLLVVDAETPADAPAWQVVPGLAQAKVENLPGATVVSFKLAVGAVPSLRHDAQGWILDLSGAGPVPDAIDLTAQPQHLLLSAHGASRVVSVADPLGGGTLLVGTLLADAAPAKVDAARLLPALALLQTWRGVAVEPLSDSLDMRPVAGGFLLDLGAQRATLGAVPDGSSATAEASGLGRQFDLPPLPISALVNREAAAAEAVAAAPPRGRGAAQIRLAEAMVALGLGAEAQAVLHLGLAADGRLASDPKAVALASVAALLAGRPGESAGLDDPVVLSAESGADEIALWRAVRAVFLAAGENEPPPAEAARTLAARQAIALAYPAPLRDRLLPAIAQALAEGPTPLAADRLIAASGDAPGLDYARALVDLRFGRTQAALSRLDRLAGGTDRSERARSSVKAVEVRLAAGQLTAVRAAELLDGLIAAWRGDDRELAVRLRTAELRAQTGQFRASLVLLRDTLDAAAAAQSPPKRLAAVHDRLAAVFAQTLAHDDASPLDPLEFVALIEDNADLLPGGAQGEQVARRVAERLDALDLPQRTQAALRRLVQTAPPGPARASLGSKLAAMQLRDGDAQAALTTLSASTADPLPPTLVAERTMTYARAAALRGDIEAATGALAALDTAAAGLLRAELLEKAGRWPDAAAVLSRRVAQDVPADGPLGAEAAALVLRLASAAAQAGQTELLSQLRTDFLPRLPAGSGADMLRVITQGPVLGVADLPRAAQEAALARVVAP